MNKEKLKELTKVWFYSDLDIEFCLRHKQTKDLALCILESNVYYEHINDAERGITVKSIRHKGDKRSFIVVDSTDRHFEELKEFCYCEYDLNETLEIIEELAHRNQIVSSEQWKKH